MTDQMLMHDKLELFPEVGVSLDTYMARRRVTRSVALDRALRLLGSVDASQQRGEVVLHVPGHNAQRELSAYQPVFGESIKLERLGDAITSRPYPADIVLHERAHNTLNIYCSIYTVSKAIAILRAVFLLILCDYGDLCVRSVSGKIEQIVLDD